MQVGTKLNTEELLAIYTLSDQRK